MKKIVVAVDLDSTLNNLNEYWICGLYNKMWHDNLTLEDLTSWDTETIVKEECGVRVFDLLATPHLFKDLDYRDKYVHDCFKWLCENPKFEVYIVSSCVHYQVTQDKIEWIREKLPFFPIINFVALHQKHLFKADILIDDGAHNFKKWEGKGYLLDMAYNRSFEKEGVVRCKNWHDVVKELAKL